MAQKSNIKTIVFRFMKWMVIILVILFVIIYLYNQRIKSKYYGFQELLKDSVECIMIYRFDANSINDHQDSVILSKSQTNRFVRKWNNSYPIGPCKYIPKFTLTVKMKGGENRDFMINGKTIKERNDYGFKLICGDNYFESIFNEK